MLDVKVEGVVVGVVVVVVCARVARLAKEGLLCTQQKVPVFSSLLFRHLSLSLLRSTELEDIFAFVFFSPLLSSFIPFNI